MITDFKGFGTVHILSLLVPVMIGILWIVMGVHAHSAKKRMKLRIWLAILIVIIRGARYVMDVYFGVFAWEDLLSLHVCHVDLILLVLCLIRPNKAMFNFCFLIGIPMALSVALFPGSNHPAPGLPRAVLFIMSHTMLITGVIYLAVTERMKPTLRSFGILATVGNLCLVPLYFINSWLGTNYLYIMEAPEGTLIAALDKIFGWPGYVLVLDVIALVLMLVMVGFGQIIWRLSKKVHKGRKTLKHVS